MLYGCWQYGTKTLPACHCHLLYSAVLNSKKRGEKKAIGNVIMNTLFNSNIQNSPALFPLPHFSEMELFLAWQWHTNKQNILCIHSSSKKVEEHYLKLYSL